MTDAPAVILGLGAADMAHLADGYCRMFPLDGGHTVHVILCLYKYRINCAMEAISYSNARARFARIMDQVNRDRDGIIITRRNGSSAVLMSLKDYKSWQQTLHLLRSSANARRLLDSVAGTKDGKARVRKRADVKSPA